MAAKRKVGDHLVDLESTLQSLAPAQTRMDAAQTMYLAGQQSVRPQRFQALWPTTSAFLTVVCLTLGVLVVRPTEPKVVYVQRETSSSDDSIPVEQDSNSEEQPETDEQFPQEPPSNQISPRALGAEWRRLADRLQRQKQLLENPLGDAMEGPSSEPAVITAVSYSDWPALLTDQSVGERFQTLLRRPSDTAFQDLMALFPRGS